MTGQRIAGCALGLAPETLILWRATGLDATQAERVRAHVPSCAACQSLVAEYDAADTALRAYDLPVAVASEWQSTRERLSAAPARPTVPRRLVPTARTAPARPWWRGALAAAAVVLLIAGFWQVLDRMAGGVSQPGKQSTSALQWHPMSLPPGATVSSDPQATGLAFSPSNGNRAFYCAPPVVGTTQVLPRVWVTRDRGQHWTAGSTVPITRPANVCLLTPDQLDPQVAVATTFFASKPTDRRTWPPLSSGEAFATFDGGVSWRQLPRDHGYTVSSLATWHGTIYALRETFSGVSDHVRLFASADQMKTWREIDGPVVASFGAYRSSVPTPLSGIQQDGIFQFWVQPTHGELLAWAWPGELWQSVDAGVHWFEWQLPYYAPVRVGTPAALAGPTPSVRPPGVTGGFMTAPVTTGAAPHVCALESADDGFKYQNGTPEQPLICTWDGGKTWQRRPQAYTATKARTCTPSCASSQQYEAFTPLALAPDDSILAIGDGTLYRLARNATSESQWTYLGLIPGGNEPAVSTIVVDSGTRHLLLWTTASGKVYTAEYPAG
jgi:hypothetical protein